MKTKNKSFKRLFAFLVALVMVTALVPSVIFAADPTFTDVKSTDWFYEHVENLAANGIVSGYKGTKEFKPNNPVTRQEAAKMIALGAKTPAASGTEFTDLLGNWADPYIMALEADGAVSGFAGTKEFKPLENIKRGHVAKMIALAFGLEEGSEDYDLTDIKGVDNEEYIKILASNGIVGGFKGTKLFKPNELVTRAQMAKIIDVAMNPVDSTFRVLDVRAINGATLEIEFSDAVTPAHVVASGALNTTNISIARKPQLTSPGKVANNASAYNSSASLSKDGKTLTVLLNTGSYFSGTYTVEVKVDVENIYKDAIEAYKADITINDATRPTLVGVTYSDNFATAYLEFSEPVVKGSSFAVLSTTPTTSTFAASDFGQYDRNVLSLDVTKIAAGDKNKDIKVSFVGVEDESGNLTNPNPMEVTVKHDTTSKAQAKIVSVQRTSKDTLTIEFDTPLATGPDVKIANQAAHTTGNSPAVENANNTKQWKVTLTSDEQALTGKQNVLVSKWLAHGYTTTIDSSEVKVVDFTFDTIGPKPVSATVVELGANKDKYLVVTFDEEVLADGLTTGQLTGTLLKPNGDLDTLAAPISLPIPELYGQPVTAIASKALSFKLSTMDDGVYNVTLAANIGTDAALNQTRAGAFSFTYAKAVPTVKLEVTNVASVNQDPSTVLVKFDSKVDVASAQTVANYAIENAVVTAAKVVKNLAAGAEVELTIKADSLAYTGIRQVVIQNVQGFDGVPATMDVHTASYSLTENVAPTVASIKLDYDSASGTYKTVTLEFSEVVQAANNFAVVKVNGVTTTAKFSIADGNKTTTATLATPFADPTTIVSVEFDANVDVADANGNLLIPEASYTATY